MDRAASPVRVQHIPHAHPYVRSVAGPGTVALPDPPVPGAPEGQWWPHPALEEEWVEANADAVDVVHLHFGFEHRTPAQLRRWVAALRHARIGLVLTVHDLRNPHLAEREAYDALLDVLVPAADEITTLTAGAAAEITRRWSRHAHVHPHPHLVDETWLERRRSPRPQWTVGMHLKSMRANVDLDAVFRAVEAIREIPDSMLRLHLHRDVLDPAHPRHDPRLDHLLVARGGGLDVRVHDPLSDEELWADLIETDLALLPYAFSTHSGWLEMCHDLGTDVLAARVGHLDGQRPLRTYDGPHDLLPALRRAHQDHLAGGRPARPSAETRRLERADVQRLHDRLHHDVARRVAG